jgi:hypothetical protein
MEELSVFKVFYDREEAESFARLLDEQGIKNEVSQLRTILDKSIIGDNTQGEVYVKINGYDFPKANTVIDEYINLNLKNIDPDYYLYEFTDDELQDIVAKADEWSNQDVIIAKKILSQRGHILTDKEVHDKTAKRLRQLAAPEGEKKHRILIGYLLSIFFCLYGIFYGLMLYNAKKLLPNGQRVYTYNERVRNHGVIITVISLLITALAVTGIFFRGAVTGSLMDISL